MNELKKLIIRGLKPVFNYPDDAIVQEIETGLKSGKYKLFVIRYSAFCILYIPQTIFETPQVLHFYSEKPHMRRELVDAVLDFVKKSGYTKLRATNGSGADDEIWKRAFRHKDWTITPVKTVFDFEVKHE
jgi:hypothetical protein